MNDFLPFAMAIESDSALTGSCSSNCLPTKVGWLPVSRRGYLGQVEPSAGSWIFGKGFLPLTCAHRGDRSKVVVICIHIWVCL
jgi:hypothetical protein